MVNVKGYPRKSKTGKIHRVSSHYRKDNVTSGNVKYKIKPKDDGCDMIQNISIEVKPDTKDTLKVDVQDDSKVDMPVKDKPETLDESFADVSDWISANTEKLRTTFDDLIKAPKYQSSPPDSKSPEVSDDYSSVSLDYSTDYSGHIDENDYW